MFTSIIDMFDLPFMVQAFVAALISGLLLSYLGVHVVQRGIVFVDLALGQISSLGVAFAAYFEMGGTTIPVVFTLAGAILMSFIAIRDKRLKQEAIIGIIYAIASAATVMLISKTPHGDSDIQEVLFGNILSISTEQIRLLAIVFGCIAVVQLVLIRKFTSLTQSLAVGDHSISTFNIWNFLFYVSIGLAIVFSVKINGVIPVFSFLIIPAVASMLLTKNQVAVVVLSLVISVLAGLFGLSTSFHYDFPAGASVVAALGAIFLLASAYNIIFKRILKQ